MIWIPFVGAISEAAAMISERKVLKKHKIDYKGFTVLAFLAVVLISLPLLYFFWRIDAPALELKNILIFGVVIFFSVIANLLLFYAVTWEKVTELEPIRLMQPLFVILLAFMLFASERNAVILIPALIASLALIFSHIKKHHFKFNKYLFAALLGSLFFAFELVASRFILSYYSGLTFYFIRAIFVAIIILFVFRPRFSGINTKAKWFILLIGIFWVVNRVVLYYGYLALGVIFTTLLFILAPVFVYLFARIFLKEKLTWRNIVATIVIVACVGWVIFAG